VEAADAGGGRVTSSLKEGSILLAGPKGDVVLVWRGREEARSLAPGTYRLRTTRVGRTDGKAWWLLSSTGAPGRALEVKEGGEVAIEVGDTVHFDAKVKRAGDRLQLGFTIQGRDGRGLSVYRNDRRVPVTYEVLDAAGAVLAAGTMTYG